MRDGSCRELPVILGALWGALVCMLPAGQAHADGFSALITPPRFVLQSHPGRIHREVIEITNVSAETARLYVQTAEWAFAEDGSVLFDNALAPESCRPWAALEARELELGPNGRRRFRFEVAVPGGTGDRECRFAILFEGEPEIVGAVGLPVSGRIGVMVYLSVGEAAPRLELIRTASVRSAGQLLPALTVINQGNAHTRLEGFVSGRDHAGREFVFIPDNSPVLPGQTRTLALHPQLQAGQAAAAPEFPIRLSGRLEWSGARLHINETFIAE